MKVSSSPFDAVFDGKVNFVPRAILDLRRADVPKVRELMKNRAIHDEDGLDEYDAVPMLLHTDDGRTRRFALWRHSHNPEGQVAIHLPLDEEFQDTVTGILQVMRIPAAAIVWLDAPVASGSRGAVPADAPPRRRSPGARPISRGEFGRQYRLLLSKYRVEADDALIDDNYSSYRTITEFIGVPGDIGMAQDPTGEIRTLVTPKFLPSSDRHPRRNAR